MHMQPELASYVLSYTSKQIVMTMTQTLLLIQLMMAVTKITGS